MSENGASRTPRIDKRNNAPLPCSEGGGEHRVEIHTGPDRPETIHCSRCGKPFVRDESWRQGYRPA